MPSAEQAPELLFVAALQHHWALLLGGLQRRRLRGPLPNLRPRSRDAGRLLLRLLCQQRLQPQLLRRHKALGRGRAVRKCAKSILATNARSSRLT